MLIIFTFHGNSGGNAMPSKRRTSTFIKLSSFFTSILVSSLIFKSVVILMHSGREAEAFVAISSSLAPGPGLNNVRHVVNK